MFGGECPFEGENSFGEQFLFEEARDFLPANSSFPIEEALEWGTTDSSTDVPMVEANDAHICPSVSVVLAIKSDKAQEMANTSAPISWLPFSPRLMDPKQTQAEITCSPLVCASVLPTIAPDLGLVSSATMSTSSTTTRFGLKQRVVAVNLLYETKADGSLICICKCPDDAKKLCGQSYKRRNGMMDHIQRVHSGFGGYLCPVDDCNYIIGTSSTIADHLVCAHSESGWLCPTCNITLMSRETLKSHLQRIHDTEGEEAQNILDKRYEEMQKLVQDFDLFARARTGEKIRLNLPCRTLGPRKALAKKVGSAGGGAQDKASSAGAGGIEERLKGKECPVLGCSYPVNNSKGLYHHLQDQHSLSREGWTCGRPCLYVGKRSYDLAKHLQKEHGLNNEDTLEQMGGAKGLSCGLVCTKGSKRDSFITHLNMVHKLSYQEATLEADLRYQAMREIVVMLSLHKCAYEGRKIDLYSPENLARLKQNPICAEALALREAGSELGKRGTGSSTEANAQEHAKRRRGGE